MRMQNACFISSDVIRRFRVDVQVHVRGLNIMYQNGTRGLCLFASIDFSILFNCSFR